MDYISELIPIEFQIVLGIVSGIYSSYSLIKTGDMKKFVDRLFETINELKIRSKKNKY